MADPTNTSEKNIVIQGVTEDTITVLVDGMTQQLQKKLDVLQEFMEKQAAKSLQSANNIYNIGTITNANFGYVVEQAGHDKALPSQLADSLLGEGNLWIQSLERELLKKGVSVSDQPWDVFQNYDWLIQTFLQKMCTAAGQGKNLRRLSFMAEAYQASLRYLCYIQMAQVLQMENKPKLAIISDFVQMEGNKFLDFDYTGLLLTCTDLLGEDAFMKEINEFVGELTDTSNDLYGTALYLEDQRRKLISNAITEDDKLPGLLDEYLTALVYWLRNIAFIANYRLVSIKEINLDYRLGTSKNFVHLYGELHSMYNDAGSADGDYKSKSITDSFTYSKSILLLRGNNVSACMNNIRDPKAFLSLSPLVVDQSVYMEKPTQTPEIYYYTGYEKAKRQYNYSQYKNELAFGGKGDIVSNKTIKVSAQNNSQPLLDELFEQLEEVFAPFKKRQS
jgi:hypothetical protein